MQFASADELQQYIDTESARLEAEREKHEPFDIKEFLDRPRTKADEAEWQAEMAKNGNFYQWLNDNRDQYNNHEWAPGINAYLNFFLGKVSQLPYDTLVVDGTYDTTTPPQSQLITLPRLQIIKIDFVIDVVYDFGIEPYYLLRIRQELRSIPKLSLFIYEDAPYPRKLQLLQPYEGEQTILAIGTEMDLYAALTILLNEPMLSKAEKEEARKKALEAIENLNPSEWSGGKSAVESVREAREERARQLSENFTSKSE